ncbi:MAG: methylenetetrahydrofolate reductase [Gammaproteobacteria bacterium]|nr:methylenetetrahydrofolate reductase [Gammaproteobacteria bacterium]
MNAGDSLIEQFAQAALTAPRYEILPLPGALTEIQTLPSGSVVTVTCSPRHGIGRTLDYAETLTGLGFQAVPHIAARLVRDRNDLERLVERLAANGISEVFIVGGDAAEPQGSYADGLKLLEDLTRMTDKPARIGVPAYPEGHPLIDPGRLRATLHAKSAMADYAVTQLCFDAGTLLAWLQCERDAGLHLPVYAGLPGTMERRKLLALGLRLGLGPSLRLLRQRSGLLGAALTGQHYQADELLQALAPALTDPENNLAGVHLFTFNQVDVTRRWLVQMTQDLGLSFSGSYSAR